MVKHTLELSLFTLALAGCQRIEVHPSLYDAQGIKDVKTWYVGFTYFGGAETETASKTGEVEQAIVQREAPRKDDLQRCRSSFRGASRWTIACSTSPVFEAVSVSAPPKYVKPTYHVFTSLMPCASYRLGCTSIR
jgi:hypothetical protein